MFLKIAKGFMVAASLLRLIVALSHAGTGKWSLLF